jgi:ATP-binding cassette, subfamily B, bacterial
MIRSRLRSLRAASRRETGTAFVPLAREVAGPVKGRLAVIAGLSIVLGLAESGVLVVLAQVALALSRGSDEVFLDVGGGYRFGVTSLLAMAAGLVLVRFAATTINSVITARTVTRTTNRIRGELLHDFLRANWGVKAEERTGHLQTLLGVVAGRAAGLIGQLARVIAAGFTFATLGVAAFALDPMVATGLVVVMGALFLVLRPLSHLARSYVKRETAVGFEFGNTVNEVAATAQDIEVFGVEDPIERRFADVGRRWEHLAYRRSVVTGLVPSTYQAAALTLIVVGLAVISALDGELASLSAIVLIFVRAASYGQQLQSYHQGLLEHGQYLDVIDDARRRFRAEARSREGLPLPAVEHITFDHVTFAYAEGREAAVRDLSFTIERGEAVGVVGPSGAGKSTLVQLLLRLRSPQEGRVVVNDRSAEVFADLDWTTRFTFVAQEPRLIAASVTDNIAYFRGDVSDDDVVDAARRAHVLAEIEALPEGFDTWVGDQGRRLSGGQRQRLSIARALAARPDVIILDEPTSALDMRSESLIQETLEELHGQVTLIIVAHRLSTLNNCDRIMVLGDGRLQAFDTAERLLQSNPFYQRAVELSRLPT